MKSMQQILPVHTCDLEHLDAVRINSVAVCSVCRQRWVRRHNPLWNRLRWYHFSARLRYGIVLSGHAR